MPKPEEGKRSYRHVIKTFITMGNWSFIWLGKYGKNKEHAPRVTHPKSKGDMEFVH